MEYFYKCLIYLAILLTGYLIGSVSWAVIVTRYFYHIDIYKVGSGNAGGTNVGRAVGKFGAILVIILDIIKCVIPLFSWFFILIYTPLGAFLLKDSILPLSFYYYAGSLGAGLGHVFPIYSHFKGGKAVSCYAGFMLGTNWLVTSVGCLTFFSTLKWKKKVSFSSLSGVTSCALAATVLAVISYYKPGSLDFVMWFLPGPKMALDFSFMAYTIVYTLLVVILHRANIYRLSKKKEPETHFLKKGEKPTEVYDSSKTK
jgi:glycerol-3-phosphate acyltransferase PlsY